MVYVNKLRVLSWLILYLLQQLCFHTIHITVETLLLSGLGSIVKLGPSLQFRLAKSILEM